MSRHHDLKCWREPFLAIVDGKKTFEFRKNDRDFSVGDVITLRDYNADTDTCSGLRFVVQVTYILDSGFGIPDGYCIMSIVPVPPELRVDGML